MMTYKEQGPAILGWWRNALHDPHRGETRALSARLRRAVSPLEALSEDRVHELGQTIGCHEPERLAALAMVLACVAEHVTTSLSRRLGAGDPRPMSELRFQRLIRCLDYRDLTQALRRGLPLAGDICNVALLGADILYWNEQTRIRWCFDYFGATPPQSTDQSEPSSSEEVTA